MLLFFFFDISLRFYFLFFYLKYNPLEEMEKYGGRESLTFIFSVSLSLPIPPTTFLFFSRANLNSLGGSLEEGKAIQYVI